MGARERVVCAMSGGVDSSVAASLLVEQGHDVIGLFMRNGVEAGEAAARGKQGCCSLDDSNDARRVADRLGIPFYVIDFAVDFGRIIDYFLDEYDRGRTPNPCIQCNRWLKFGRLLEKAQALGAAKVATGHYARIVEVGGRHAVARGRDDDKDQSYVLFPLEQEQLERTLLPLGELRKDQVRQMARERGLPVHAKPDSQEICFVPDDDYGALIRKRRPEHLKPGDVVDAQGRILGPHAGHQLFTIGQRRGFGYSFGRPVWVIDIDPVANRVVVGDESELLADSMRVEKPTWSACPPLAPGEERRGEAKIRSHHRPVPAVAVGEDSGAVSIRFDEPVRSVTLGQAAVLYDEGVVLLGGFIDEVRRHGETATRSRG